MNSNSELVSVVMSVYNSEATVEKSVHSLMNQTYKNLEILIINDGSSDGTRNLLTKFKSQANILIFDNKENKGLTKALNQLIKVANGKFIARQDGDDYSFPERIEKQVEIMKNSNLDFCSSRAYIKNSKKKIPSYSHYLPYKLLMKYKNPFIHGTLIIKKSVLEQVGLYDERFYYAQDYKLMKDLIKKGYKYKVIKDPLYELNMSGNISSNQKSEQKRYADYVRKEIKP